VITSDETYNFFPFQILLVSGLELGHEIREYSEKCHTNAVRTGGRHILRMSQHIIRRKRRILFANAHIYLAEYRPNLQDGITRLSDMVLQLNDAVVGMINKCI
jgi:hypothetical protein